MAAATVSERPGPGPGPTPPGPPPPGVPTSTLPCCGQPPGRRTRRAVAPRALPPRSGDVIARFSRCTVPSRWGRKPPGWDGRRHVAGNGGPSPTVHRAVLFAALRSARVVAHPPRGGLAAVLASGRWRLYLRP